MSISGGLLFAKGKSEVRILPNMVNRHGLIAGAGIVRHVYPQINSEP